MDLLDRIAEPVSVYLDGLLQKKKKIGITACRSVLKSLTAILISYIACVMPRNYVILSWVLSFLFKCRNHAMPIFLFKCCNHA